MTDSALRQPIFNIPSSVTVALVALVAIHFGRQLLPLDLDETLVITGAVIPARFVSGGSAGIAGGIPGGAIAVVTSLVTHMLLHANVTHLVMNSIWLLVFGSAVAKRIGPAGFFALALTSGIAGALVYIAFEWGSLQLMIGASGAVSGLTGAALRFYFSAAAMHGPDDSGLDITKAPLTSLPGMIRNPRILTVLAAWLLINFGTGIFPELVTGEAGLQIAWQAHLGGFLFGLLTFGLFDRFATAKHVAS